MIKKTILLFSLLFYIIQLNAQTIANGNVGFEATPDFDGWTTETDWGPGTSQFEINTIIVAEGANAAYHPSQTVWEHIYADITGLSAARKYVLLYQSAGGNFADVYVGPSSDPWSGTYYYHENEVTGGTYNIHGIVFTASTTTMQIRFDVYSTTNPGDLDMYLDDFQIIELPEIPTVAISSRSTGRWLTCAADGNAKFKYSRNDGEWYFVDNGDGSVRITSYSTTQVLGVKDASNDEDASLQTTDWAGTEHQKWTLIESNGYYTITNVGSGLILTAADEYPETEDPNPDVNYYNIYSQVGNGVQNSDTIGENQRFHIHPVKDAFEEALVVPQLGWKPDHSKRALLILNNQFTGNPSFEVSLKSGGDPVLTGTMELWTSTSTWAQFYYYADLTALSTPGEYEISAEGFTANITIAEDIYGNPKYNKGGIVRFQDMYDGFWKYNRYYDDAYQLPDAIYENDNGNKYFTFPGGETTIEPYGWFDAHSRDSKVARTAKAIVDMAYAWLYVENAADKASLEANIEYGMEHLFIYQNGDGSWPAGKVRQFESPRTYYYWTINVDVNTSARCVRALAMGYLVFKDTNPQLANDCLAAARVGWTFVVNNQDMADLRLDGSHRGHTVDILAAAVEMAYATDEDKYFSKADSLLNLGTYTNGAFKKLEGSFPSETGNGYLELDLGTLSSVCRYLDITRTEEARERTEEVLQDWMAYWTNFDVSPFGFPQHPLDRTTDFGNVVQLQRLTFNFLFYADHMQDLHAFEYALTTFYHSTGFNPYATTYWTGLGDPDITPSAAFMKRGYERGIGGNLPGHHSDGTTFTQNYVEYQATEGVVPTASNLFYILARLNTMETPPPPPGPPAPGDLVINEVNSLDDDNITASWIEIYNQSGKGISLEGVNVSHFQQGGQDPNQTLNLTGEIDSAGFIIISRNSTEFEQIYEFAADYNMGGLTLNQGTDGILLEHDTVGIIDQMNVVPPPDPLTPITRNSLYLRKDFNADGSDLENHWCEILKDPDGLKHEGSPGMVNVVTWKTDGNTEWHTKTNWDDTYQPCVCNDVVIPAGGNQPIITTMDACAMNVVVESGAELIILGKLEIGKQAE